MTTDNIATMTPPPHPDWILDEEKLRRVLRRRGITVEAMARRLGISRAGLERRLAYPPAGWRQQVETALGLALGALRFRP